MARMPRLVVPGYPHHVTQRGARCMKTFFSEDDQSTIRQSLSSGRPAGDTLFVQQLEQITGRELIKKKPGPKMEEGIE